MLQWLPGFNPTPPGDQARTGTTPDPRRRARGFLGAGVLLCLPALLSAQARASVQVAAQVLPAGPSRTALELAVRAVGDRFPPSPARSRLARIRLEPTPRHGASARLRVVRIDFLRN